MQVNQAIYQGSPPHARGKVVFAFRFPVPRGITPACAGKRLISISANKAYEDHPRMRGEKLTQNICFKIVVGITPACAGKSRTAAANRNNLGDHPRMRGEK